MGTQDSSRRLGNFGLFVFVMPGKAKGPAKLLFCGGQTPSTNLPSRLESLQK